MQKTRLTFQGPWSKAHYFGGEYHLIDIRCVEVNFFADLLSALLPSDFLLHALFCFNGNKLLAGRPSVKELFDRRALLKELLDARLYL